MSKSGEITKRDARGAGEAIVLPNYESGPLSTHQLAQHLSTMIENWREMDGETFARANGTARSATKFWDTVRGLERLSIEREKLVLRMGALPARTSSAAA